MKKQNLAWAIPFALLIGSCTNQSSTPSFYGDAGTRGYCGKAGQEFEVPISQDIDLDKFEEVSTAHEGTYRALGLSVYVRENAQDMESPQVMATHRPMFNGEEFLTHTFNKNCARGLSLQSSQKYEVTLPIQLTLGRDKTWTAQKTAVYTIEYDESLNALLELKVEDGQVEPSASDRDFLEVAVIQEKASKKKNLFKVLSFKEFKNIYSRDNESEAMSAEEVQLEVEKQYARYLELVDELQQQKPVETSLEEDKQLIEIAKENKNEDIQYFLQVTISEDPRIYARVHIHKVLKTVIPPTENN